jgi:hypothetical protein
VDSVRNHQPQDSIATRPMDKAIQTQGNSAAAYSKVSIEGTYSAVNALTSNCQFPGNLSKQRLSCYDALSHHKLLLTGITSLSSVILISISALGKAPKGALSSRRISWQVMGVLQWRGCWPSLLRYMLMQSEGLCGFARDCSQVVKASHNLPSGQLFD